MIKALKSFLDKCNGNSELTFFAEGLLECWMHGYRAMYWNIEDDENLLKIKDFFKEIYSEHENFYSIKRWQPDQGRKEYEIKWYFNLEDIPKKEEQ